MGFFGLGLDVGTQKVAPSPKRGPSLSGCDACNRYKDCHSPKLGTVGDGSRSRILVVTDAPTKRDDSTGQILSGDTGRALYSALKSAGVDLKDVWVVPAIKCAGPSEGKSLSKATECCRQFLFSEITRLDPSVVIPLGPTAVTAVLGERIRGRLSKVKPTGWFGMRIPDQETGRWICPTYSLKYVLDGSSDDKALREFFHGHVLRAVQCADAPFPKFEESIQLDFTPQDAIATIRKVKATAEWFAFDYETTGLKPQAAGHAIVCASVAWRQGNVYHAASFPFFEDRVFRLAWKALLMDPRVGKVAHNNPFEAIWTYFRAAPSESERYWPVGWCGDTQAESHFEDSSRPNGLKFRTFALLGILGYDDAVDAFLKADGTNGINRIREVPMRDLLTYNAKDSLYSAIIHDRFPPDQFGFDGCPNYGLNLLLDGQATFAKLHANGLPLDTYASDKALQSVTADMARLRDDILGSKEAQKMPRDFNFESPTQLANLLYDKLGYGDGSSRSTDSDALETIGTSFATNILAYRKLSKVKGTYLEGFTTEAVNGIVHPFFNLTKVVTYRSSSDSPNFQNIPKRDKAQQKIVRSCFRPSPGNVIGEYDYGQIEVRISACYHHDPNMLKYVEDPTTDMHRDMGIQLFFRTKETLTKPERQIAKNGFVFPSFYGSTWRRIAPAMWEQLSDDAKDNLAENKIRSLASFEKHVKAVEDDFWGRRFRRYDAWRKEVWRFYQKHGYVDLLSGFRVDGPMTSLDASNYPIQGSAFHCMLYTLNQVVDRIAAISGRSRVIGQIHDAIVLDMHPDDIPQIDRIIWFYGTQEIRRVYPWIIVPLIIEKDLSEVDGTWASMKGYGGLSFDPKNFDATFA